MSGATYSFQLVDVTGADVTAPTGIDNAGVIVGTVDPNRSDEAGFYGTIGSYTTIAYPGSIFTSATGISPLGTIVGTYTLGQERISLSGYELSGTTFTDISIDAVTVPLSINLQGDVAGAAGQGFGSSGYLDIGGQITGIENIGGVFVSSIAGLNDSGDYVGNFTPYPTDGTVPPNPPQDYSNFAFEVAGSTTTIIDVPGSYSTQVTGINDGGEIVGYYYDNAGTPGVPEEGAEHGFIYENGQYQTIDYPGSGGGTALTGINDLGEIVGTYGSDGFIATPEIACYCRGTRLLTPAGEVAVEDLRIGDILVTHGGAERPIRWIGTRSYAGRFAAANPAVLPVLIAAGALDRDVPKRDLWVSPLHALYLDGMLIPAAALVNGTSIRQLEALDGVDYFHVELDTHDIILAEGAASETFVDDDNRGMFHNAVEYHVLYPQAERTPARYCAPRAEGGDAVEAVFQRILARTRPEQAPRASRPLGHLDSVTHERISGWARGPRPGQPALLRILDDGILLGTVTADEHRADLHASGVGDGRHGFSFVPPDGLSPLHRHVIAVQRAGDGADIPNSPWVLEAAPVPRAATATGLDGYIDALTRERISGWVRSAGDPDTPVVLQVLDNGQPIARVLANHYRPDLVRSKQGSGRHGFEVVFAAPLSPLLRHVIQFRREPDGCLLEGPPFVIEAARSFTPAVAQAIEATVAAAGHGPEQARLLAFMMTQADRLLRRRADAEAQRTARGAHQRFLRDGGSPGESPPADPGLRALVIDQRVPREGRDAGSQAVLSHIRALQRLGYAVSLAAADDMAPDEAAGFDLEEADVTYCAAPFYTAVEDVLRRQAGCFDLIYLHRAPVAACYLPLAHRYNPHARIVYSVADLHHVRLARQAAIEDRPDLLAASRRMQLTERIAAASADAVITHSGAEAVLLRTLLPQAAVHHVAWDVPVMRKPARFAARRGVGFIGAYMHAPNVDAAHWLVEAVMPLVWQVDPAIECRLVGTDMPRSVQQLAGADARVVAVGAVEDLGADPLNRVRLTVAPLRYGAGINGKVLASLAAGVPCVMSPIAAEGMPLCDTLKALVGRDAAALAALICTLHADRAANAAAADAGLALLRRHFSAETVTAALRQAVMAPVARAAVA